MLDTTSQIDDATLAAYGDTSTLAGKCRALIAQQRESFPMLAKGYAGLESVQVRSIDFEGFAYKIQFNPARITSTAAKIDPKSIQERKCFLCHRPPEQRGIAYGADYLILCNPFPIWREHFTIITSHRPQRIRTCLGTMLALARDLDSEYVVLYNGPKAGASAPDHLHLQAGERGFLTFEAQYAARREAGRVLSEREGTTVWATAGSVRPFIAIESRDAAATQRTFERIYDVMAVHMPGGDEPSMNVYAYCDAGALRLIIFPRAAHRPSCYSAEGDAQFTISPGAADLGGVLITPVERDFVRMNPDVLCTALGEVCVHGERFEAMCAAIAKA